jgi:hypothetical protein
LKPTKTGLIHTEGIGQDKGITSIILGARHTMAIPEPVELFGMNRKEVEAAFGQPLDNRAPWDFDGHGEASCDCR